MAAREVEGWWRVCSARTSLTLGYLHCPALDALPPSDRGMTYWAVPVARGVENRVAVVAEDRKVFTFGLHGLPQAGRFILADNIL